MNRNFQKKKKLPGLGKLKKLHVYARLTGVKEIDDSIVNEGTRLLEGPPWVGTEVVPEGLHGGGAPFGLQGALPR